MLKTVDRIFGWLLILATLLHTMGTVLGTQFLSGIFVWSLGAALASGLLGALNLVRAGRPADRTLALITAVGTAGEILIALAFGLSIGNLFDPRPLMHVIVSLVLLAFSIRTVLGSRSLANKPA